MDISMSFFLHLEMPCQWILLQGPSFLSNSRVLSYKLKRAVKYYIESDNLWERLAKDFL